MKQISEIILIMLLLQLKFAHSESSCQIHLIILFDVSVAITDQNYQKIVLFAKDYKTKLESKSYNNSLTTSLIMFSTTWNGDVYFSQMPYRDIANSRVDNRKPYIIGPLEAALNRYRNRTKFNIILILSEFVFYDYNSYNVLPLSHYKDLAKSKNTVIQIAAYGDRWNLKHYNIYVPSEAALQLTKSENIFYRQNADDLKSDTDKMLTDICNKFQQCEEFPADTIPNVMNSGNCNYIDVNASCSPTCKKLFRPNSSVFCNSDRLFEIKDFKCVPVCIEKPSIANATEESLRKCAENNNECNIVCADGYEYNAQFPVCDESDRQWKLSSSKCEIKKCGIFNELLPRVIDKTSCDNIIAGNICKPVCDKSYKTENEISCNMKGLFEIKDFKCVPLCNGKPSVDNATEESLRKCAENNKECDIVCDSGYEFNRRPPVCDETKGEWISSESQCKKSNFSFTILLFTVNSLSILSFFVAIIAPELINLCCVRNHVIGETLTSDSDEPDHYADITDPVINIRESK